MDLVRHRQQTDPPGVEPLSRHLTATTLGELLGHSRQPLKIWLLRQDRLVGLGNIYASEILFAARLSPLRPAGDLSPEEVQRLHRAMRRVLRAAIDCCGTTFSDFQDAHGAAGSFQECLAVYSRAGDPCHLCETPVKRLVQQQRSTFWCPRCQV
jgi:formamidopyrimidine-DNA glycosylase